MKRLLLTLLIGLSSVAHAQHGHYNHRHGGYGYDWVTPLVVGGVVTYALTRPQPVIVQQQPVIVQPAPAPVAPYGYHYENILDANCNCYRLVLVSN